jgi:hypothetical protein
MKLNDLVNRAKQVMEKRGGTDALKKDAEELKDIARGPGTAQEKAKRAADALKDPGAPGRERPAGTPRPDVPADKPRPDVPADKPGADRPAG